jgi:pyruvate dehydrogenase E2 component (dihydrolipoamide acetyltransferase)
MPKLGNTMESAIIVRWMKQVGDTVAAQDTLCEIETDKATMEVESPVSGTLLEIFFREGDDVPVMTNIAAVGVPGEDASSLRPPSASNLPAAASQPIEAALPSAQQEPHSNTSVQPVANEVTSTGAISPRARRLAARKHIDAAGIVGSGPRGRIIERDVRAALADRPKVTPVAKEMLASGAYAAPEQGTGIGGRIMSRDLVATSPSVVPGIGARGSAADGDVSQVIQLKGARRVISQRMLASIQTTAQLTLNTSADARALLAYRKRLKASPEALGLQDVTINDLLMYVVSRTVMEHAEVNAHFADETITAFKNVHLGFAVDTPRGLIVPVVRSANRLTLKQMAVETRRLADACQNGTVTPDELTGGTFTITNLGSLGIETFTPILNPPQVAILGVGSVNLKPIEVDGAVQFIPHVALSLTINHQVVDGAPGARFLQQLSKNLADLELVLAV